jgi:predicted double-glycine peptidase
VRNVWGSERPRRAVHERRRSATGHVAGTRRVALAVLLSLAWGAAAPAASASEARGRKTVRSLQEIRTERVVRQAWDLSCGSAALSTLLTYDLGDRVAEAEIISSILRVSDPVRIRARRGFSLLDLKRFAESRGHVAEGYGSVDIEHLARMAPAIVPTTIGGYNHFVVFRGVRDGHVLLADPAFGNRTMTVDRFEALWPQRIAFVVRPAGGERLPSPGGSEPSVPPPPVVREAIEVLR